jgi:hypothetical protein
LVTIGEYLSRFRRVEVLGIVYQRDLFIDEYTSISGGKGGPGKGIGNDFLRSKAEKRAINGFTVFITELPPVSRRENVIVAVEEEIKEPEHDW